MSGGKGVVFALADARKAGQPAALAQMSELLMQEREQATRGGGTVPLPVHKALRTQRPVR